MPAQIFQTRTYNAPDNRTIAAGQTIFAGLILTDSVNDTVSVAVNPNGKNMYVAMITGDPDKSSFVAPERVAVMRIDHLAVATLKASTSVAAGAELTVTTGGKVVTATSTQIVIGTAIDAATAADQYINVRFVSTPYAKA